MGLTRKEIKQDQIRSLLMRIYDWSISNRKYLIGGLGLVVLAILVAYLWGVMQDSRQRQVQGVFSTAMAVYHAEIETDESVDDSGIPTPVTALKFPDEKARDEAALKAFDEVIASYPATQMADWSRLYSSFLRERLGEEDAAVSELNELSRNASVAEVRNLSARHLCEKAAEEGRTQDAIVYCKMVVDDAARNFPLKAVTLQLAQLYEKKGDYASALSQYRRIAADWAGSAEAQEADTKISQLASQEPIQ